MEKRYPFTEKRCAQRHAFPNAAPFRKLPFFPCQTMIFMHAKKLSFIQYMADKSAVGIITAALVWLLYQII